MGVVFGKVEFEGIKAPYEFFKKYCYLNKIEFTDHPTGYLIITGNLLKMEVRNEKGIAIKGLSTSVYGMDDDIFEIQIIGVPYPLFKEEFPQHTKDYMSHKTIEYRKESYKGR